VSLLAGRYDEAERVSMPAYEALKAYGEAGYFSTVTAIAGLARAGQGRYEEAELLVDEARAIGAEDDVTTQAYWRAGKARILAGRGDSEHARQVLEESLEELDSRRLFDRVLLNINGAEVHRLTARPAEARRLLDEALAGRKEKGIVIGDDWLEQLQAEL
jgi:ATP/maltotriose-dependent transcriptional regulator MalT